MSEPGNTSAVCVDVEIEKGLFERGVRTMLGFKLREEDFVRADLAARVSLWGVEKGVLNRSITGSPDGTVLGTGGIPETSVRLPRKAIRSLFS